MDWLNKLPAWIKLSPKFLAALGIFAGVLLFAPAQQLKQLGLDGFVDDFRPYLGAVFLVAVCALAIEALVAAVRWIHKRYDRAQLRKKRIARLHKLTPEEKVIMLGYHANATRTLNLSLSDGVVNGLETEGIVFRSSNVGDPDSWPYNIQPWVWDLLQKDREGILSDAEIAQFREAQISPERESRRRSGYPY